MSYPKKLTLGICGASGVHLGVRFANLLPKDIAVFIIPSEGAKLVYEKESKHLGANRTTSLTLALQSLQHKNTTLLDDNDLGACVSSGSFGIEAMCIIPASGDIVAKIACGISDTLISRAACVMLKERKELLLGVREMPLSPIMLENMLKLSNLGVHIAPPIAGYYGEITTLQNLENFFIGKWFDLLGIPHHLFTRWG